MASLLLCGNCGTPLLSTIDLDDPASAASALQMSYVALRGDAYATNVYVRGRGCPICGWQSPHCTGIEPPSVRRVVHCTRTLDPQQSGFVQRHSTVHFAQDHRSGFLGGKSPSYALIHSALRHFVLGPGSSTLGDAIGALGLMEHTQPNPAISFLCGIVKEATGSFVDPSEIEVSTWEIRGGICVVVVPPEPQNSAEAYLAGVTAGLSPADLLNSDLAAVKTNPQFFVLEKTRVSSPRVYPAMLCQWKSATRRDYYDNERRNYGWGPNPVVADFLDSIERIMVSGLWK